MDRLFEKHELKVVKSLKSRSIFHDGLLNDQTVCGAFRGPVLRAIDLLTETHDESDGYYPANDVIVGPCWGALLKDGDEAFFDKQRHRRHQYTTWDRTLLERTRHHTLRALQTNRETQCCEIKLLLLLVEAKKIHWIFF